MKILLDARFLEEAGTGIKSYVSGLLNGIAKSNFAREHECILIVHSADKKSVDDFKYQECDIPVVSLKQQVLMPRFLLRQNVDIYHYPHFDLPFAFFKKAVITIYDLKYIKMPELFHNQRRSKSYMMKQMMVNSCKRARKIITISESSKNDIVNVLGVPPEKVFVVYCASDSFYHETTQGGNEVLKKYHITYPFLLYVGEVRPHKNVVRLIQAFKRSKTFDFNLIIVGKSYKDYREPFDFVKRENLEDRVKFLKYVSKEDLLHLYNRATVFVLPSLYEGFGLPVLEAMACGTPVITSNISSLPEVGGDAAILVDPYCVESIADGINMLLLDESLQQRMRKRGCEQLRKFSWLKAARETIEVYKKVLS